jgi:hypothetical protein
MFRNHNIFVDPNFYKIKEEVSKNGRLLKNYKNTLYANSCDLVISAVKNDGNALKYASNSVKDEEPVVALAFISNEDSLQYASLRIQEYYANNPEYIENLISMRPPVNLKPAKR